MRKRRVRKYSSLRDNEFVVTDANIKLPDDLLAQAQRLAQAEGKTADELAAEAVKREVARRLLAQIKREAAANRAGMTDEQVEEYVDRVVHEYRAENRGR